VSDEPTVDSTLVADLKQQLAACQAELGRTRIERDEALRQQTASAEILEIINRSPGDLAPVFDAILERATRIGEAKFGIVYRFDGEVFRVQAVRDATPAFIDYLRREPPRPDPRNALGRALHAKHPIHIADIKAEPAYTEREPSRVATVEIAGARTFLAVPMLRDDRLIGVIAIYRQEVRPFSTMQIELARTLANHASIAIENARLLGELSKRTRDLEEALEYQAAVSDVLKVISRSAFDLQPVLDTVVKTAARLCAAEGGAITLRDGEVYRYVATTGVSSDFSKVLREQAFEPGRGTMAGRVALEGTVVHIADITADSDYVFPEARAISRTLLGVPLLREGAVVGTLTLNRQRVEPFTPRQVELVQTFADQAVIAVESARLLGELHQRTDNLQESLEYQTAVSDVLKVISRSTFDLQRVLDTLIQTAAELCETNTAALAIRQGDVYRYVATARCSPEYDQALRSESFHPGQGTALSRVLLERKVVHIADASADPDYRFPAVVNIGKVRTILGVPMFREDEIVGVIALAREHVEPFSERQIELVRTFADQAVIAIENARLITETREALEQQTATAEVLGVISSAPGQLQPVFERLLESALRLCNAHLGSIHRVIDGAVTEVVKLGAPPEFAFALADYRPPPHSPLGRMLATKSTLRVRDYVETQA
jgi:GAF domain-containing protein